MFIPPRNLSSSTKGRSPLRQGGGAFRRLLRDMPYRTADPYSRLRVPVYRKAFEAAFFVSFLFLYYAVLVERKSTGIGIFETLMYIWIAAFAYDEFSGMTDAGMVFYQMDFWSVWNIAIIGTGLAFMIISESCSEIRNLPRRSAHYPQLSTVSVQPGF